MRVLHSFRLCSFPVRFLPNVPVQALNLLFFPHPPPPAVPQATVFGLSCKVYCLLPFSSALSVYQRLAGTHHPPTHLPFPRADSRVSRRLPLFFQLGCLLIWWSNDAPDVAVFALFSALKRCRISQFRKTGQWWCLRPPPPFALFFDSRRSISDLATIR